MLSVNQGVSDQSHLCQSLILVEAKGWREASSFRLPCSSARHSNVRRSANSVYSFVSSPLRYEGNCYVMATSDVAKLHEFFTLVPRIQPSSLDEHSIGFRRAAICSYRQDTAGSRLIRWITEVASNNKLASNDIDDQVLRHLCPP